MKKLLVLLTCIVLMTITGFGQIAKLTLNGYTDVVASNMGLTFKKNNGTPSTKTTSVFFKIEVINRMVALLGTEKGSNDKLKGIRIYYVTDNNNQNTVALLSSYVTKNAQGKIIYQDYFEHNGQDPLFKIPATDLNGRATDAGGSNGGASLYSSCATPCPDDIQCTIPQGSTHYITRKHAEDMVHMRALVGDTINTKSEWFPLCLFENIDTTKYDGIRIYYGKHPTGDALYPNRDTFVIELTKGDGSGGHMDAFDCTYAQCDVGGINSQLKKYLPNRVFKSHNKIDLNKIKALKRFFNIDGLDNGELCPSNCDGELITTN